MAAVRLSRNHIVCIASDHMITFPIGGTDCHIYRNEKPEIIKEKSNQPRGNEEGSLRILACTFSKSGRHFVTCDDYKQVTLWRVQDDGTWSRLSTRLSVRRVTSATFTNDESVLLVADKSGDVYRFSVDEPISDGQLLMGHVSMLLDLVLLSSDQLLATCDRDEKVRISHHPNTYSIYSYCLGHTDFVSQLIYLEEEDVIISGSGDGTLRVWDYHSGQQLCVTACQPHSDHHNTDTLDTQSRIRTANTDHTDDVTERRRNGDGVDLKRLVHCRGAKLIVAGFERLQVLLLYKYTSSQSERCRVTLTFTQEVILDGSFWDMTFDTKGHLWVLQAYEARLLEVFRINPANNKLVPLEAGADEDNILTTVSAVCNKWHLFKDCVGVDGLFSVLHKVKVDNAQFYRQRKHQRLEEEKRRYKAKRERRAKRAAVAPSGESIGHREPAELATSGDWEHDRPEIKKNKLDG